MTRECTGRRVLCKPPGDAPVVRPDRDTVAVGVHGSPWLAFDVDGDGIVTVDAIVSAVNAALGGCPG